ncbi:MAG TPA: VWA domain-containing protein, partial [Pirellulales bacterium]
MIQSLATAGLLAEAAASRTSYDFEQWQALGERWHVLALLAVCAAVLVFVVSLYRRDSVELRPGRGLVLLALRVVALLGVLAYFLELEKRTERTSIHNSRVVVLVDTSLSMGLQDADHATSAPAPAPPAEGNSVPPAEGSVAPTSAAAAEPSRLDQVVALLDDKGLIRRLREVHDVVLVRFDAESGRLATLGKLEPHSTAAAAQAEEPPLPADAAGDETAWKKSLRPQGVETRLGQALRDLIHEERAAPVSGIVVFSDGGQNAGIDVQAAILAARDAKIPLYTVGVGSDRRPAGVRIADFVA